MMVVTFLVFVVVELRRALGIARLELVVVEFEKIIPQGAAVEFVAFEEYGRRVMVFAPLMVKFVVMLEGAMMTLGPAEAVAVLV